MLPVDHVVAAELKEGADSQVVETIPDGMMGLDIGPKTVEEYSASHRGTRRRSSGTARWACSRSPRSITAPWRLAKAVASSGAVSVVGGGDSEKAVKSAGCRRQDLARLHRRRRIARISVGHRTARRRRAERKVAPTLGSPRSRCAREWPVGIEAGPDAPRLYTPPNFPASNNRRSILPICRSICGVSSGVCARSCR